MRKTQFIIVFVMVFICTTARASEADLQKQIDALKEQMSKMSAYYESKINELEEKIEKKDNIAAQPEVHGTEHKHKDGQHKHHHGLLGGKVNIIGGLDARYVKVEKENGTLILHEAKIGAQADIADWLSGYIAVSKHHGEEVEIEEAYAHLLFDKLGLSAKPGKFFVDFGPENKCHFFDRRTITLSAMHEGLFGNEPWSDTGLQIDWELPLDFYSKLSMAMVNGNNAASFGDGVNTVSNDSFPVVASWHNAFHTEYGLFELGPSFSWGKWDHDDKRNVCLVGGNVYWQLDNFDAQMEFIYRYKEQPSENGGDNAYGYYIWGAYTLPLEYNYLKGIEFLTSFGQFIPDTGSRETRVSPQICFLLNDYAKLRASYEVRSQSPKDRKDNRFITQFALVF